MSQSISLRLVMMALVCAVLQPVLAMSSPFDRVAPYLRDDAIVAIRVDLEELETAQWESAIRAILTTAMSVEEGHSLPESVDAALTEGRRAIDAFVQPLREGGAREMFFVFHLAFGGQEPMIIVVPIPDDADEPDLIHSVVNAIPGPFVGLATQTENAVVAGRPDDVRDLPRVDTRAVPVAWKAAFESAGDAALQVIVAPPPYTRRAIIEIDPSLPDELGGGSILPIVEGFHWHTLSLSATDGEMSGMMQIKVTDGAAATAGWQRVHDIARALERNSDVATEFKDVIVAALETFDPDVRVGTMRFPVTHKKLTALATHLVPTVEQARENARHQQSAMTMRMVLVGCNVYAADTGNLWPETLDVLVERGMITEESLRSPVDGRPYVYVRPDTKSKDFRFDDAVLYESYDTWPAGGIWVGFADGHIELVQTEESFRKRLGSKAP